MQGQYGNADLNIFKNKKKLGGRVMLLFPHPVYYQINIFQLKRILYLQNTDVKLVVTV